MRRSSHRHCPAGFVRLGKRSAIIGWRVGHVYSHGTQHSIDISAPRWCAVSVRAPGSAAVGRLLEGIAVGIVLLIGTVVLVQFIFGIDFGIEQVLSRTNELLGSTPLGRMSPLSAIAFLLEGAALLILLLGERWRNASTAIVLLATGAIAIHTVVLIGYVFGAPLLYGGTSIPVALPAAIALCW